LPNKRGGRITVLVVKPVSQSYLTQLWNKQHITRAVESPSFIDGLSRYFTYIVFAIGAIAATYWFAQSQPALMWNALTTILIVACPCALLLSANFTYGNMLRILSREKLYLRHANVLEKLSRIDTIVLDKTGTITKKDGWKIRYEGKSIDRNLKSDLAAVLANSTHPLSLAVYQWLDIDEHPHTNDFKIEANRGIEGWVNDKHIKIGSPDFTGNTALQNPGSVVCFSVDGKFTGTFFIENIYRDGVFKTILSLKNKYNLIIASGDNAGEENKLREVLGAEPSLLFNQKPEDKLSVIQQLQAKHHHVLMAGDGLNDAAALQASDVGIAIAEDNTNFTPAADGILHASNVTRLDYLLRYAKAGRHIIHVSFGLSILYNVVGLYYAVQGTLSPVIAAILMPVSSVSIILLTYSLSGWLWCRINASSASHHTSAAS
jgi:Cu+-exporting ATPase